MEQLKSSSLVMRIAIGKALGLVVGLVIALSVPAFYAEIDMFTRVGIILWYPTMGAFIGVFGVFTKHPVLDIPLPWWIRAPMVGAWMNFVLVFLAYDSLATVLTGVTGHNLSPFWFVLEGGLVGALIGYVATSVAGEGAASIDFDERQGMDVKRRG